MKMSIFEEEKKNINIFIETYAWYTPKLKIQEKLKNRRKKKLELQL